MLLLFDIDGTLVQNASSEHAAAIHQAIEEVHGVDVRTSARRGPEMAGRTDGEIARLLLRAAGVDEARIDARAEQVRDRASELYAHDLCPADLSDRVAPGIAEILGWLEGHEGAQLALVTGNYEAIARFKLKRAGIGHFFPFGQGGFGSDSEDRAALPTVARRRAGNVLSKHAIVIGDTPRDIACARADGVRCLAVTTGPYNAEALAGADWVAESTDALRAVLSPLI